MGLRSSRHILFVLGLAAIALFALTSEGQAGKGDPANFGWSAQPPQARSGSRPAPFGLEEGRIMLRASEDIGLADKTMSAIAAASRELQAEEAKAKKAEVAALRALNELLNESLASEKELLEASAAVTNASAHTRELRLRYSLEIRGLLDPGQLKSYMARRKSMYTPGPNRR